MKSLVDDRVGLALTRLTGNTLSLILIGGAVSAWANRYVSHVLHVLLHVLSTCTINMYY